MTSSLVSITSFGGENQCGLICVILRSSIPSTVPARRELGCVHACVSQPVCHIVFARQAIIVAAHGIHNGQAQPNYCYALVASQQAVTPRLLAAGPHCGGPNAIAPVERRFSGRRDSRPGEFPPIYS